jgi:phospholipid/cholesterol/gamma-HCH transport system substrate-binding protein
MATGTNHWKLGLLVIFGICLSLAALVALGARNWNERSVNYVSFFDESVQGLELGSPVKFRGVTIGRVSRIDIAPDQRHVEVTSELTVAEIGRLSLGTGEQAELTIHPELRVQLAQTGITGVKFILLDYFDPVDNPPPALPFSPPKNYIPAASSTLKNLESSLVKTADRFPAIAEDLSQTMATMNGVMDDVERGQFPAHLALILNQTSTAMQQLNSQLTAFNAGQLSQSMQQTLVQFNVTLDRTNHLLESMESERGLLSSAQRAMDSLGETARGAQALGPEMELTLRDVRGAARSIRRFADALERDPDMLLKGRAQVER